jgi:hypothetical protein
MPLFEFFWIIIGVILLVKGYVPLTFIDDVFVKKFGKRPTWLNIRPLYVRLIGAALILINIRPFFGLFNMIIEMTAL